MTTRYGRVAFHRIGIGSLLLAATVLSAVSALSALSAAPQEDELKLRIIGKWVISREKSAEYLRKTADPAQPAEPNIDALGGLQVNFLADGNVEVVRDGATMVGRWKFVAATSESAADIELIRDDEATAAKVEFTPAGSMLVQPAHERGLVFDPAPETPKAPAPAVMEPAKAPLDLGPLGKLFVGQWQGDPDATEKLEYNAQFQPDEVAAMLQQMKELQLHATPDGLFAAKFGLPDQEIEMTGRWSPLEDDEAKKTLVIDVRLENGPQTKFTILFLDSKSIRMAPENQPAVILHRKPAVNEKGGRP